MNDRFKFLPYILGASLSLRFQIDFYITLVESLAVFKDDDVIWDDLTISKLKQCDCVCRELERILVDKQYALDLYDKMQEDTRL